MKHLSSSQASTKIKEARKKTSTLVTCLFVLVSALLPTVTQAFDKRDVNMEDAYEQIFGKHISHAPQKQIQKNSIRRYTNNDFDLIEAYQQLFSKKQNVMATHRNIKLKSHLIKREKALHKKAIAPAVISKEAVITVKSMQRTRPVIPPERTSKIKATNLDALFAKAFGKKATTVSPSKISVELRINKTVLGDVTVFTNKQGSVDRVDSAGFLSLLKGVLKDNIFKKISKQEASKKKILFGALAKQGVNADYNSTYLSLDLTIDSALRKPLVLSMQTQRKTSVRGENKIIAEKMNGYLNMYSNLGFSSGGSKPNLNMKFEGSFSVGKAVFESTLNMRDGRFSSDRTRITYDKPEKLQRFMLGDISTGSRSFQENLRLTGFRVSKEFYMDPDLQIRPKANESFVLETDSEVEVLINNQLRHRYHLRAGIYSLEDIGLYDGANNIRLRIKDEFGKVTEKTSQQFYDSNLLKKDLSVYAFSVGYLSDKQVGANNNLIKDPVVSGYYQKGFTKDLTMGVDLQLSPNSYLLGSEFITSISLGRVKGSFALSGGKYKGTGGSTRFEFRPNKQLQYFGPNSVVKNWSVNGELRSKEFSLLNSSDSIDVVTGKNKKRLKARVQTNLGLDLGDKWRGSMNLALTDYYDADKNASINLMASRRFLNSINLNLGAHYDSGDKFSVNLQLSIPLSNISKKRKANLDILANSKFNTLESKLSLRPHSEIGRNSLAGSLEYVQNDSSKQKNLDMQYRGTNFEANLKARNNLTKNHGQSIQHLNIGFNSSLACIGKQCAMSYPVHDSFALVSGPSNQITPIALNNGNSRFIYSDTNDSGLPDNYTALIQGNNKKAVMELESYRYQSINVDESTLPNGYDTEKTEFEVFPRYHQGFLIKAGGEPATILNGIFVNAENKPLGFKGGQWIPENMQGKAIAFFSNKAGRFRVTSIPAGKYKLELFDYPDMQAIDVNVPDLKGKVHDLGILKIIE
jgi:outer membrane usher protein